jgi:hypothetical protein
MLFLLSACIATGSNELAPCNVQREDYIVRRALLPSNFATADKLGFDFDGDGTVDNALGSAAVRLQQFVREFRPSVIAERRLKNQGWRLSIGRCTQRPLARIVFQSEGDEQVMLGSLTNDGIQGQSQHDGVRLPLGWLADSLGNTDSAGWTPSLHASLNLHRDGDRVMGRLTVALDPVDVRRTVLPPIADFLTYTPSAKLVRQALDNNRDGIVTVDELASSPSFLQLTAPDLSGGVVATQPALSLGVSIEAQRDTEAQQGISLAN